MNEKYIFSKRKEISPREVWKKEPNFSKWFETQEGKEYLEDILGIQIATIETEKMVGNYRLDVYAIEEETGHAIIVENQYETTDHKHLGQLITYAAGLSSSDHPIKHIIWISEESREEAESAIKWLNEVTNSTLDFFLLKPKIFSVGESKEMSFEFDIVTKPNDFEKAIQKSIKGEKNISTLNDTYLDFWLAFDKYLVDKQLAFKKVKARPQKWMFNRPAKNQNVFDIRRSPLGQEIAYKFCVYNKETHLRLKNKLSILQEMFNTTKIQYINDDNTMEWGFIIYSGIKFEPKNYKDAFDFYIAMYKKAEEVQAIILNM